MGVLGFSEVVPSEGCLLMFVLCQLVCIVATYQDKAGLWSRREQDAEKTPQMYMWVCSIIHLEPDPEPLEETFSQLQLEMDGLRTDLDLLCSKNKQFGKATRASG